MLLASSPTVTVISSSQSQLLLFVFILSAPVPHQIYISDSFQQLPYGKKLKGWTDKTHIVNCQQGRERKC
jgi:hypothetical protein